MIKFVAEPPLSTFLNPKAESNDTNSFQVMFFGVGCANIACLVLVCLLFSVVFNGCAFEFENVEEF